VCNGQVAGINKKDSIFTTDIKVDTLLKKIKSLSSNIQSRIKREEIFFINSLPAFNNKKTDSVFKTLTHPFSLKNQFKTKPFIKFNGGYNTYNFNYRSYIDTPIAEIKQPEALVFQWVFYLSG
jgi:hypothetical protein